MPLPWPSLYLGMPKPHGLEPVDLAKPGINSNRVNLSTAENDYSFTPIRNLVNHNPPEFIR
jgi:hypothetical protein